MIFNILKILFWFVVLFTLLGWFGPVWGSIYFAVSCLVWNILITVLLVRWKFGRANSWRVLMTMFSGDLLLPFTVYGCYCSPRYGYNWKTGDIDPVDGLDAACKGHDITMFEADRKFKEGIVTKRQRDMLKNSGDWSFVKKALTSRNHAGGIYLLGLIVGFLGRVSVRSLRN